MLDHVDVIPWAYLLVHGCDCVCVEDQGVRARCLALLRGAAASSVDPLSPRDSLACDCRLMKAHLDSYLSVSSTILNLNRDKNDNTCKILPLCTEYVLTVTAAQVIVISMC